MPKKVKLPSGKSIDVPDDATPEEILEVANQLEGQETPSIKIARAPSEIQPIQSEVIAPPIAEKPPSVGSFLSKAWDTATTPLAGHEPSMEEWQRDPMYSAMQAGKAAMTTPLGIVGEVAGVGIGALKAINRLRKIAKPAAEIASEIPAITKAASLADELVPGAIQAPKPTVQKLLDALDVSKLKNVDQAEIYRTERAPKFARAEDVFEGTEESFIKAKGQLAGEHTKVQMAPVELEQADVDDLFKQIKTAPNVVFTDQVHAGDGLRKILEGRVPQDSEIKILEKIFGEEITTQIRQRLPKIDTRKSLVSEYVNLPRSVQAAYDISFPFRQGLGLIHTKAWWTSWDDMLKSYGSEKAYRGVMESILEKPNYQRIKNAQGTLQPSFAERAGLALTDLTDVTKREEAIMSTIAEKIPGVRASNRAYTAFANKLRADNFDSLIELAEKQGLKPRQDLTLARELAQYVNNASGRGNLGKLERSASILNGVFFSPRLIASRLQMMNPRNYLFAQPMVRKQYLKSLLAMGITWTTMGTLGKMAGAEVSLDTNSADFGKIKIGNTRFDPAGGFQQYIVLASRLAQGKYTVSTSQEQREYGKGFGSKTRMDALTDFITNKLAPIPAYGADAMRATEYFPFEAGDRTVRMFTPILIQDLSEIIQEDPAMFPLALGSAVGLGVQHYGEREGTRLLPEGIFPRESDFSFPSR